MNYMNVATWKRWLCRYIGHRWLLPDMPAPPAGAWAPAPRMHCARCGAPLLSMDQLMPTEEK